MRGTTKVLFTAETQSFTPKRAGTDDGPRVAGGARASDDGAADDGPPQSTQQNSRIRSSWGIPGVDAS